MQRFWIVILFLLAGCLKELPDTINIPSDNLNRTKSNRIKNKQTCDFGLKEFNLEKRTLPFPEQFYANRESDLFSKEKRKPKPPPVDTSYGVLLLDFNGAIVENTSWNFNGPFYCSPANLTSVQVDEVLQNIRGEYANFRVIVTTNDSLYQSAKINKRMRLIFTETWEWYGQAGGVAFINSYTWGDNTPCFVFTSLLNYNTKFIKEAGAHELGHTIGLYHQAKYDSNCVKISDYNSGANGEAPIMGVSYYVPDPGSRWWVGPNSYGCNSIQNDTVILNTNLGRK